MTALGIHQAPFDVISEQRGHTVHLRLSGEIDISTTPVLESWLHTTESDGTSSIIVDLEQVTFMDAGGLRAFLRAAERAVRDDRAFAITSAPAIVTRILEITGTTHLLSVSVGSLRVLAEPLRAITDQPSQLARRHTAITLPRSSIP